MSFPVIDPRTWMPPANSLPWSGIVVHHTFAPDLPVEEIDRMHRDERGWSMIGYPFYIRPNGAIHAGRPLDRPGAHAGEPAPSRNKTHIGVALAGSFHTADDPAGRRGPPRPTWEQYTGLALLARRLIHFFKFAVKDIEPHHTRCPGDRFDWTLLRGLLVPVGPVAVVVGERLVVPEVAPLLQDGKTYLPVRALADAFGHQVEWQPDLKTVRFVPPGKER